ncbi:hypothetical protein I6B53_03670 [Schaalia sp. 19OD2882]|uniref:hypothetical protein n=1 Tax=Schaalia sp. 19OD2882 TaxID=2794089 RepID=UPI001C1EADF6|nr:hypothetical protein [Schaalia sp. 19OD2882]QWW20206.1 hypothetical protein I6B53_03670 [Schaalia sp. 19OD2882]
MELSLAGLVPLRGRHETQRRGHDLVLIRHGFAIPNPPDASDLRPWQANDLVARARILATCLSHAGPPVFSLESALRLHGLPTLDSNPDVTFHTATRRNARILPPVAIGPHLVASVRARWTSPALSTAPVQAAGVWVDDPAECAVRMAMMRPFLHAMVAASSVLRHLSGFNRFEQESSRLAETRVRHRLIAMVEALGHRRGVARARLVLTHADAGGESVGERVLLALLLSMAPELVETQVKVVANGRLYFLDLAMSILKIAFEFDGVLKMGSDPEQFRRAQHALLARQRDLEEAGWTVIRVGWVDFSDLAALRARIIQRIERVTGREVQLSVQARQIWALLVADR